MNELDHAADALRELEALLASSPRGSLDPVEVDRQVRNAIRVLSRQEPRWIDAAEAKRLLGFELDRAVPTWAWLGLLRSRTLPCGQLQVRLDDVLVRRAENEALMAIGGEELTPEELRLLHDARPGTNPWEREQTG